MCLDLISSDMTKCCRDLLAKPICHLFNSILNTGKFPSNWNTDIMVPIHKSGSVNDPANYRPIVLAAFCISYLVRFLVQELVHILKPRTSGQKTNVVSNQDIVQKITFLLSRHCLKSMFYIMVKNYMLLLWI